MDVTGCDSGSGLGVGEVRELVACARLLTFFEVGTTAPIAFVKWVAWKVGSFRR